MERSLEDVKQFKSTLKEALSQSFSGEPAIAEQRFQVLSALVKRIASQEKADKNWRALVLDFRQHVEFVARELDSVRHHRTRPEPDRSRGCEGRQQEDPCSAQPDS
jgi:uncharacterized protein YPO0396